MACKINEYISKLEKSLPDIHDRLNGKVTSAKQEEFLTAMKKPFKTTARILKKPEIIKTIIDGEEETSNKGKVGDYVITGPKGEEYIIKKENLTSKYNIDSKKGNTLNLSSKPVKIKYKIATEDMKFKTSWGEDMIAHQGDSLVYENGKLSYRIEKEAFNKTYELNNKNIMNQQNSVKSEFDKEVSSTKNKSNNYLTKEQLKSIISKKYGGDEFYEKAIEKVYKDIDTGKVITEKEADEQVQYYSIPWQHSPGIPNNDKELFNSLVEKMKQVYPEVDVKQLKNMKDQDGIDVVGKIINGVISYDPDKAGLDTLPHEYAHHYIAMFREAPIVQEAIKKWGGEEELVQAIGEQVVKQKGEVYGWWKEFSNWVKGVFGKLSGSDKEQLKNILTDAFLKRTDAYDLDKSITSNEMIEQPDIKGRVWQDSVMRQRIEDHAWNIRPELNEIGTKKEYDDYIKTIFPDSLVQDLYTHTTYGYNRDYIVNTMITEIKNKYIKDTSQIDDKVIRIITKFIIRYLNNGKFIKPEKIVRNEKSTEVLILTTDLLDKIKNTINFESLIHLNNQKIKYENGKETYHNISFGENAKFTTKLLGDGEGNMVEGVGINFYLPQDSHTSSENGFSPKDSIKYPMLSHLDIVIPVKLNIKKTFSVHGTKNNIKRKLSNVDNGIADILIEAGIDKKMLQDKYTIVGKRQVKVINSLQAAKDLYGFNSILNYMINPKKGTERMASAVMIDNNDIHILGSDKDIRMFKEWKAKQANIQNKSGTMTLKERKQYEEQMSNKIAKEGC